MIITGKRKMKVPNKLLEHMQDSEIYLGFKITESQKGIMHRLNFTIPYQNGETRLPPSGIGPVSKYNSEGKELVHKDQPMETAYSTVLWNWEEWDGTPHSKFVDRPYKRYPRTFISPPSIELTIIKRSEDEVYLISPKMKMVESNYGLILHVMNLFLEIFESCVVLNSERAMLSIPQIKRVNWRILPKGKYPWTKLKDQVKEVLDKAKEGKRVVIKSRLEKIAKFKPEFVAIGEGGFHGYLVFGFPVKNIFILDSAYYGNATYIFDKNWKVLSKMTKAEIIAGKHSKIRIVHNESWYNIIEGILNED